VRALRIAVAGLGRMGAIHADNLTRLPGLALAGVVDADAERARAAGMRLEVPWSTDYDTALHEWDADAVVVAAPTALHPAMIEAAAAAGRHVLCEKPLAETRAAAGPALAAAARAGITLQVGFHRRFDPDWVALKARLQAGEAGDVIAYRASLRDRAAPPPGYLDRSGGIFTDMAIHELDAARWLAGEIDEVAVAGAVPREASGAITTAAILLRFASGAVGMIDVTRTAGYGYEASTEVMGTRATLRVRGGHSTALEVLDGRGAVRDVVQDWAVRHRDAYRAELEAFAAAIRAGGEPPVTGADALAAATLAEACDRALATGRAVRLERETTQSGASYRIVAEIEPDPGDCAMRNIDLPIVA
jgi:myo-inositol 2-dehydrogenase/D-chiro-inositol 1-dehydrogenase